MTVFLNCTGLVLKPLDFPWFGSDMTCMNISTAVHGTARFHTLRQVTDEGQLDIFLKDGVIQMYPFARNVHLGIKYVANKY